MSRDKRRAGRRRVRPHRIPLHVPADSGAKDWRQVQICTCGSAWDASMHRLPETDPDAVEIDRRRVGEMSEVDEGEGKE